MKIKALNIKIPTGSDYSDAEINIPEGVIARCSIFTDDKPSYPVDVRLEDVNSEELHPFVSYKEYQPTNGNHYESRKSLNVLGNRTIRVIAKSRQNVTEDFDFQMIFYVEKDSH